MTSKTKLKSAWRVVTGDIADSPALPAATGAHTSMMTLSARYNCPSWLYWTAGVTVACAAAFGAATWTYIGFDWGYFLVERLAGQPGSPQGTLALMLLVGVLPQMCFAALLPWLGRTAHRKEKWLPFLFCLASYLFFIFREGVPKWSDVMEIASITSILFPVSLVMSYITHCCAEKFMDWVRSMNNSSSLAFIAMLPLAAAGAAYGVMSEGWTNLFHHNIDFGMAMYTLSLAGTGALAGFCSKTKRTETAIVFSAAACLPLIICGVGNVLMTLISLLLDQFHLGLDIGWRAALSAAIILPVTIAAITAGGFAGGKLRQRLSR